MKSCRLPQSYSNWSLPVPNPHSEDRSSDLPALLFLSLVLVPSLPFLPLSPFRVCLSLCCEAYGTSSMPWRRCTPTKLNTLGWGGRTWSSKSVCLFWFFGVFRWQFDRHCLCLRVWGCLCPTKRRSICCTFDVRNESRIRISLAIGRPERYCWHPVPGVGRVGEWRDISYWWAHCRCVKKLWFSDLSAFSRCSPPRFQSLKR